MMRPESVVYIAAPQRNRFAIVNDAIGEGMSNGCAATHAADESRMAIAQLVKSSSTSKNDGDAFRHDWVRLIIAGGLFCLSGFLNALGVGYAHSFAVKYLNSTQPLEDSVFRLIPLQEWAWKASDISTGLTAVSAFLILSLHRYWSTVVKRMFLVVAFLYLLRGVTLVTTFLPPPFPNGILYCLPPIEKKPLTTVKKAIELMVKMGSTSDGKEFMCGDTIFSGHTMIVVVSAWYVCHYAPRPISMVATLFITPLATFSLFCIIISRQHYTVDVVVAIFISIPIMSLFEYWIISQRRRYVTGWRAIFYPIHNALVYFEKSTEPMKLSEEIAWPLPWPGVLVAYFQSLNRISLRSVTRV